MDAVNEWILNDSFIEDDILSIMSEESQKESFFPFQAGTNTRMLNQTSERQLACVNTSFEANSSIIPYSFSQSGTSQPQNIPYTENKMVTTATNQTDKKKLIDKQYRQRIKENRKKLENELQILSEENAYLKSKNDSLKKEKDMMNKDLQSAIEETKQLKSEILMLKHNISRQQILVDAFTQKLINDDHQLELTELENKIAILSQNFNGDDWMAEKGQLLGRVKYLEHQNKVLKVQVEALCERINNEKDNEDIQAWVQGEMVREKDRFWGHVEDFKCKFCGHDFARGSRRIKSHLEGVQGCDIEICTKVPTDVQAAAYPAICGPNKKAKIMSSSSNFEESKTDSTSLCKKKDKSALDKLLTQHFLLNNIEFDVVQTAPFTRFVQGVAEYGPEYELPSLSTLCMKLIPDSRMQVEEYIRNVKKSWVTTGCTLIFDTRIDMENRAFTNIIAYSPGGAVFIHSFEVLRGFDIASSIIEEIGLDHVVQFITVDDYDIADSDVDTFIYKYPRIYKTHCVANWIQRLLKDIYMEVDWVNKVIDDAKLIASYMYKHNTILSLMREYTNNKELKHPCVNRFACNFQMLKSIFDVKNELRLLVASSQWRGLDINEDLAKKVNNIIQSTEFWNQGLEVLQALEPLVHVVQLVDSDGSTSGYLYEAMERAKEAMKQKCADNPAKYMQIWELLGQTEKIIHPIHAAAAFFNPAYMCSENFREDKKMKEGINFISKNLVTIEERVDFLSQLEVYRMKNSRLFTSTAMEKLKTCHPRIWWDNYGDSVPTLRKYAIRILSQPCSSFLCKQDLRAFEAAQPKKRNRLAPEVLDNLVYTRMNTMMMEKFNMLEAQDLKPIDLDKLPDYVACNQVCAHDASEDLDIDALYPFIFDDNVF